MAAAAPPGQEVAVKASKVAYKPVGLALGALSGILAGGLFK